MGRRRYLTFLAVAIALVASYHLLHAPTPSSRYHALFLTLGSNASAAAHLRALTLRPHVAGTEANAAAAEYVRAALASLSFPTRVTPYSVLLSYPVHRSLSIAAGPGLPNSFFSLVQETYPGDPYATAAEEVIPTYFAYSGSGSVAAEVVYANYGEKSDYAYLASRGVDVDLRAFVIAYGELVEATYDGFNSQRRSPHAGSCIYGHADLHRRGLSTASLVAAEAAEARTANTGLRLATTGRYLAEVKVALPRGAKSGASQATTALSPPARMASVQSTRTLPPRRPP